MKLTKKMFLTIGLIATVQISAQPDEILTTLNDQKSVAVTIYNENLALIKDKRSVKLANGLNYLAFRGVSARMRPETALLRSVTHPGELKIIEQNFNFDLLTPQKLLEKYVGKQIRVVTTNPATGVEKIEQAIVLSTNNGVVLKIGDRIETNHPGRFIFDDVPKNLRDQPTLSTQLLSGVAKTQEVELSYLSSGLSWKADYVAELNEDDSKLDLLGWVTLDNKSGTAYNNAKMQLVAGDVNQVRQQLAPRMYKNTMALEAVVADSGMQEESLFEYHLYTLGRATTILDKQTKQVSLLTASEVQVKKEFLLQGNDYYYSNQYGEIGKKMKVGVFVQFDNEEKNGLGVPLPKGIVRVYKRDKKGNAQFIGEDRIDHTPKKETVRLKLGDAFDITANKTQTDFQHIKRNKSKYIVESAFEVELKNAKPESVTVVVREPVPGDWTVVSETHEHKKVAANTAEWHIKVPAESSAILSYKVRVVF